MVITALGRALERDDRTNVAIVSITLALMAIGTAVQFADGAGKLAGLRHGLYFGASGFLGWALGREFHPDAPLAAFAGTIVAMAATLALGPPTVLASFWCLLMMRTINRTPGPRATWLDTAGMIGMTLWFARSHWPAGLLMAAAFALDASLPGQNRKQWLGAAVLTGAFLFAAPELGLAPGRIGIILASACIAFAAIAVFRSRPTHSIGDKEPTPLHAQRVQAAIAIGALAAVIILLEGPRGIHTALPIWAAIIGTGGWRIGEVVAGRLGAGRAGPD